MLRRYLLRVGSCRNPLPIILLCVFIIWNTAEPSYAECLGPSGTWIWKPVQLQKGLGIKQVEFRLSRAENVTFNLTVANGKTHENFNVYLENQVGHNFKIYEPQDQGLKDGTGGIVYYTLSGHYHWGNPDQLKDFGRIEKNEKPTNYHEDLFWTGCGDQYPNSSVKVEFSNFN